MSQGNKSRGRTDWRGDRPAKSAQGKSQVAARPTGSKRGTIVTILALMLGLAGVLVAAYFIIRPFEPPRFVTIAITEYKAPFSINPWAAQDSEALVELFPGSAEYAFNNQEKLLLLQKLNELTAVGESFVLHLSALARSGPAGEVFIFPADANPNEPRSWIGLDEVIEIVQKSPAREKLLILDVMQPTADSRIGVLANDVGATTRARLEALIQEDPTLLVLCAAGPGQLSHASEPLGRTVFGYYLEQGLRGPADGYSGDSNGRVSVKELAAFTTHRVDRYCQEVFSTNQIPYLIGSGPDFELSTPSTGEERLDPQESEPSNEEGDDDTEKTDENRQRAYPIWLTEAWRVRDASVASGSFRLNSRVFRELEATLLRAELQWRGGYADTEIQSTVRAQSTEFQQAISSSRRDLPNILPRSITALNKEKNLDEFSGPVETLMIEKLGGAAARPGADSAMRTVAITDVQKTLDDIAKTLKPTEGDEAGRARQDRFNQYRAEILAWAVFKVLVNQIPSPEPDQIKFLLDVLKPNPGRPPMKPYVESVFLEQLSAIPSNHWNSAMVALALRVVASGEETTNVKPELFPLIGEYLRVASRARHEGEAYALSRGYVSWDTAQERLQAAQRDFESLNRIVIPTLTKAKSTRDRAFARLPGFTMLLNSGDSNTIVDSSTHESTWSQTVQETIRLDNTLAALSRDPSPDLSSLLPQIARIDQETRNVDRLLSQLERTGGGDSALSLSLPWLSGQQRSSTWAATFSSELAKSEFVQRKDDADNAAALSSPSQNRFDSSRFTRMRYEMASRRAGAALELLGFVHPSPSVTELRTKIENARSDQNAATWARFGTELKELSNSVYSRAVNDADRSLAVRAAWAAPTDMVSTSIALEDSRQATEQYQAHLAAHSSYRSLDWQSLGRRELALFFDEAAREYQRGLRSPDHGQRIRISGIPVSSALTRTRPRVEAEFQFSIEGLSESGILPNPEILTADDEWLNVTASKPDTDSTKPIRVPLQIEMKANALQSDAPAPAGFLVRLTTNGRAFHAIVPTGLPTPDRFRPRIAVLSSADPDSPAQGNRIRLRPNVQQELFFFAENPTEDEKKLILELQPEGAAPVKSGVIPVPARSKSLVRFGQPPAPGQPAKPPELKLLPTGVVTARLYEEANPRTPVDQNTIRFEIAAPREYISIVDRLFDPSGAQGARNRLLVELATLPTFFGPNCRAELVVTPARIPGLIETQKEGNYLAIFNGPRIRKSLTAENLAFERSRPEVNGLVTINVDGFERAFILRTTFSRSGAPRTPELMVSPEIRLTVPSFAAPGKPLPIALEVDNEPSNSSVHIGLFRTVNGRQELNRELPTLPGGRQQQILFSPESPTGAALFATSVKDWATELETAGIFGRRKLVARMLDRNGREIRRAEQDIVLDGTPPDSTNLVRIGSTAVPVRPGERPIEVEWASSLEVIARARDSESDLKSVKFYLGRPAEDKMPSGPQDGKLQKKSDDGIGTWSARLPLPAAPREGPIDLTVQFINGVDMQKIETITVILTDPFKPKETAPMKSAGLGSVAGRVTEGNRIQTGLEVTLAKVDKEEGDQDKKATTNARGQYLFKDVEPGSYTVSSSKTIAGFTRADRKQITVQANARATADLNLKDQ